MSISLHDMDSRSVRQYVLSQIDKRFVDYVVSIRFKETSSELRFVVRNDKKILQQLILVCGEFENPVQVNHIWYPNWDEWVWMDVPCVVEDQGLTK